MSNKVVGTYPSEVQFLSECYKSQWMGDKIVYTCLFVFFIYDSRNVW